VTPVYRARFTKKKGFIPLTTDANRCIIVPEVIKHVSSGTRKAVLDTEEMREISTTKAMAWRGNLSEVRNRQALSHEEPKEVGMQEMSVSVQRDEWNDLPQKSNASQEVVYRNLADVQ